MFSFFCSGVSGTLRVPSECLRGFLNSAIVCLGRCVSAVAPVVVVGVLVVAPVVVVGVLVGLSAGRTLTCSVGTAVISGAGAFAGAFAAVAASATRPASATLPDTGGKGSARLVVVLPGTVV